MAIAPVGVALPGFSSPAVGPEAPFEMLSACHARMHRTLQLLQKLIVHLQTRGHDASAADAARDVLRYFQLAAPQHHLDEELHIFGPLIALKDASLTAAVQQLQADHRAMEQTWSQVAPVLQSMVEKPSAQWLPLAPLQIAVLHRFIALYDGHIAVEEERVYPRAQALLSPQAVQAMSADMVQRRRSS